MPSLGSLFYTLNIRDLTDADLKAINAKLQKLGSDITLTPKFDKDAVQNAVPKGIKITLDPELQKVTDEKLQKAVEGKVMKVEVSPLLTKLRQELKAATSQSPVEIELGVNAGVLRNTINKVLQSQGFIVSISTITGDFTKKVQQQLNGRTYNVTIHANAQEISRSIQASLMQVQSRTFGLQITKDVLLQSIDNALAGKRFYVDIQVRQNSARQAVQNALNLASIIGKDDALAYQRLKTGELKAAQAELAKLKAAHQSAADAAKAHTSASINLGGAMGSNIKIAGELGSAMASLYSIHAAKQFLSQVVEIGGELEHQKIALETIYGSESKMQTLYGQIKGLARQSPFGVMDLTKNIKQLSAYGVAYNEVYDTAKRLADISAATSVDIQRLILAFGKTKNRTFLDGLEAKQFAYANIPIYDALSKKLTELEGKFVSVKDVMGRIKKREIGFDMVKEILWDMTDEGGKFYNMQEKLAGSVKTSWKLVRDNIELMFGEIAEGGVGESLKNIGQTLQEVTRSWQAFASVIGAGAISFGVYKLAVMGTNVLLERQTASIVANHLAEKQRQAAALRSIGITSTLSAREKEIIATRKRLTAADLEYLFVEKDLTKEEIKRLYLSGKISREELQKAVALGVVTQAEFEQIAGTNALNGAWIRFKATMAGTWDTVKRGVASAFGMIFNWTTAAFAAIAGLTYLVQHNMRENEIADDFTKTWKQRGEDMAKEISASLSKPIDGLSDPQSIELINEYKNLIKDYASLPDDVIQRAIYDKDGNIRNTADQIKYLREELESLKNTAESMSQDMGAIVGATGDGWFKEDVVTNLKDYSDAYNKANSIYLKFVNDHKDTAREMVDAASSADAAFAQEIANAKNLTEQFSILMRERQNFPDAWNAAQDAGGKWATKGGSMLGSFGFLVGKTTPFEASLTEIRKYKQAMEDVRAAMDGFWTQHEGMGWDWVELTNSQAEEVRQFYNKLIETAEISSPELKRVVADKFQEMFNVKIISDKTEEKWMVNARNAMASCADEATKEAIRVLIIDGEKKLTDAQRELIKNMFQKADDETKKQLPDLFENAQSWINQHDLFWRIRIFIDNSGNSLSQTLQDIIDSKGGTANLSATTTDLLKDVDGEGKSIYDIRNALQEKRQNAKNKMDAAIKGGLKETTQSYKDAKQEFDNVETALKELGWTDLITKDNKSNKEPKQGTQEDAIAKDLKQQFKDIKDAYAMYKEWAKLEGSAAAFKRVGDSGLFSTLAPEDVPRTVEEYLALVDKIENKLKAAGIKGHSQRESLANELIKERLGIKKDTFKEQLQLALDKVSKEAERQLANWTLYDKIKKATGNENLAIGIAFGMKGGETDYVSMVKKQFADLAKSQGFDLAFDNTTLEQAKKLGDNIAKSYQDTANKLEQYARQQKDAIADILNEYQSLSDKLAKIDAERERKTDIVRKSGMGDADKAALIQRINVEADYQKFTQSNEYLQFFSGIYALTLSQAQQIGDLIERNLDRKLQAGAISAEDYYKEIERVRKQLDKLRNVKSDALTFLSEGAKGLNQKRQEVNEAERLITIQKIADLEDKIAKQKAEVKGVEDAAGQAAVMQTESQLKAAKKELEIQNAIRDKLVKNREQMEKASAVMDVVSSIAHGMADAFNTLRDMADALGFDTDSNAWNTVAAVMDTMTTVVDGVSKMLSSLLKGDIGGIISGAFDTILTPVTIWSKIHDKKLQKDIEKSQQRYNQYDRLLSQIERRLGNHLGGYNDFDPMPGTDYGKDGAFGYEREMKKAQLAELQRQQADMEAMKKKDKEGIEDLKAQISELKDEIAEMQIEAAKDIYGVDIQGWAQTIGDALWDAFMKGEDALEAFDKAVASIMSDVVKNILKVNILERAFQRTRDWLASEDGPMKNGVLTTDGAVEMWNMMKEDAKLGMDNYNTALAALPEDFAEWLKDNYDSNGKSGLSAGIQSITEDTADLLASYVNAIRASTSMLEQYGLSNSEYIRAIAETSLPQLTTISESQLRVQEQIAENTLSIRKSNDEINRLLVRVTQGGAKFHVQ